ncbi:MAG TPA: hypothetical protein VJO32_07880 [Ktedonobacteraceae bacterium]|nr:hypothetical protein [Ktedonobacteraceae bacterium]
MTYQDEFFTPDEIDGQIKRVSQRKEGEQADAEAMAYLRSVYGANTHQEQEMLDRIWNRIARATPPLQNLPRESEKGNVIHMQIPQSRPDNSASRRQRTSVAQRLGMLAAAVFLVILVGSMAIVFQSVRNNKGGSNPPTGSPPPAKVTTTPTPTAKATTAPVSFEVTSVDMAVNPTSIAGMTCGTNLTVTYTATFHVASGSNGGTVQFQYSVNNGRGSKAGSLTFGPGETTKTYAFTWSGALPFDHTYPSQGGVVVTSPNAVNSPMLGPTGTCSSAAFNVTGVTMSVSPTSIAGMKCGTNLTVTYTATFHVAPNSSGGTVQFQYTINNGRGSNPASLAFDPGVTSRTYSFTWSGALPADHTYPAQGGVIVTSPNALAPVLIAPTGQCS